MSDALASVVTQVQAAWPQIVVVLHTTVALIATVHVVLTKEEPRSAVGWVGLIWLSPALGAFFYYLLGINRIRRKAVAIRGLSGRRDLAVTAGPALVQSGLLPAAHLVPLAELGDALGGCSLTRGNALTPLVNGDEAFPAMLAAIRDARRSIMLSSYIFDYDDAGREFARELEAAVARGVEVRVLVDATGARYSFPSIVRRLRRGGVPVATFLPNFRLRRAAALNLRSHRKIMVVDGRLGFTGGMNIRQGNYNAKDYPNPIQDLHFRVEGPVVAHLREAFIEDWAFTTKEMLSGPTWLPPLHQVGDVLARGILDGPDNTFERILWTILGAICRAQTRVRIVTPYFIPDPTTIRVLSIAAMSGVTIEIVLPEKNNIPLVQWAAMASLAPLLRHGVRIYLAPPPFDHTKMMLVDDGWVLVGSANWDPRSLRLNFEFNVECFSVALCEQLDAIFAKKKRAARRLLLEDVEQRSYPVKLRDGVVRLLAPYL